MTTNVPTGYDDATRAELVQIRDALRPLVAGARAVTAPAWPDPRRILDAVDHPDFWGGLRTETRRLIIWHGVADALNDLCRGDGAHPEAQPELSSLREIGLQMAGAGARGAALGHPGGGVGGGRPISTHPSRSHRRLRRRRLRRGRARPARRHGSSVAAQ